jgi:putative nucleotidyltransferase with HDIG domain
MILAALFAALFTAIASFELFWSELGPRYGAPTLTVARLPYAARIVRHGGDELYDLDFQARRVVIARGTVLDPSVEEHRALIKHEQLRRPLRPSRLVAAFALYFFGLLVLTNYFSRFGHPRLKLLRSQGGLFGLMAVLFVVSKLLLLFTPVPAFWIPLATVALWGAVVFDRRTALLLDGALAFMVSSLARFDLLLLTVFLTRGIVVSILFRNRKQPRQMIPAGIGAGMVTAAVFIALDLLFDGSVDVMSDIRALFGSNIIAVVGGGLVAGILGVVLREPAEQLLGHVSRAKLLDLTDIEAPLLRKMAAEAPGSWEHSRAMANLAEAAAAAIGADSLLTRVGAYYHDLGKTIQPRYFIENLAPGEPSPHEELAPEVSADAIMAHVVLGTKILREGGVPEPVVEFAYTHHGTQLVEFFWNKYRERPRAEGEPQLDERHFRYPGMKPLSKETAILMLVDAIEAASRTIQPPNLEKFEEMIQRVVFHKLKQGQLDDSGLTLTDVRMLAKRMASTLVNMYHGRIKYPWQHAKEAEARAASEGAKPAEPPSAAAEAAPGPRPLRRMVSGAREVSRRRDDDDSRDSDEGPLDPESYAIELRRVASDPGEAPLDPPSDA